MGQFGFKSVTFVKHRFHPGRFRMQLGIHFSLSRNLLAKAVNMPDLNGKTKEKIDVANNETHYDHH